MFKISTFFKSAEEIDTYLSGDKITCLECGKSYKVLGYTHLKKHNMTMDEYKDKYGIPYNRPLVTKSLRKIRSEVATENLNTFVKNRCLEKGKTGKRRVSKLEKEQLAARGTKVLSTRTEESHKRAAEKNRRLTKEQIKFLVDNHEKYSFTCWAEYFDVSGGVISNIKRDYNLKFPRKPAARDQNGKFRGTIRKMIEKGVI